MSSRPGLGEELAELRLLHQELGYRLKELEDQVLGAATSSDRAQLPIRAASIVSRPSEFERVSAGARDSDKERVQPAYNPGTSPPRVGEHLEPQEFVRSQAAIDPGKFILRCLTGQARGPSGRRRLKLPNSIYVVVRDYQGRVYDHPVKVFTAYSAARAVVGGNWAILETASSAVSTRSGRQGSLFVKRDLPTLQDISNKWPRCLHRWLGFLSSLSLLRASLITGTALGDLNRPLKRRVQHQFLFPLLLLALVTTKFWWLFHSGIVELNIDFWLHRH